MDSINLDVRRSAQAWLAPLLLILLLCASALGQSYTIHTFAGNGHGAGTEFGGAYSGDNGPATSAELYGPSGVAVDAAGNLYIADQSNNVIRKVWNGVITTIAGNGSTAELVNPWSVAVDKSGNVYIADQGDNTIRKVSNGVIYPFAGNGGWGYSGDDGPATSAQLIQPSGVAVDASGNVYIADTWNNVIRKVSNGVITTIAGNGYGAGQYTGGYSGDNGPATNAALDWPQSVAVDTLGNVYIADTSNNVIRKVSNGVITTIAGNGHGAGSEHSGGYPGGGYSGDNGPATEAELNTPLGVAVDAAGNVYIGDANNNVVRKVSNGVITTIAGNGSHGYSGDDGPATSAELYGPCGVAVDGSGNVYIADSINNVIRVLAPTPPSAGTASMGAAASSGSFPVSISAGVAWSASSNDSWITITGSASGTGSGTVSFSVQPNTGAARTGTITIAGQTFTITQESASTAGLNFAGSLAQIASAGGWDTTLTLVNLDSTANESRLNTYAGDGSTPWLPYTFPQQPAQGTVFGATFDQSLAANASLVFDTTGPSVQASVVGSAQLLASGNVGGFGIFQIQSTGQQAVVPLETRNAPSYLLAFDYTGGLQTGLALANVSAIADDVKVIVRDDTGAVIPTTVASIHLDGDGHKSFMLNDVAQGFPEIAGKRGTVEFDTPSGGQISVLGLRAHGTAITTLPVLAQVGTTGGSLAHVATGAGWETLFTLVNTGTSAAKFTLNFYDENTGVPLPLSLTFPQTGTTQTTASLTQTLAPGATLLIETQGGSKTVTCSAHLTTTGNVSGFAIFQIQSSGQEAVVPLETRTSGTFVLAYDNTSGLATGLALANVSATAATVPVTVLDDTGATLTTGTIPLAAYGHTSFMLTDNTLGFPLTAGKRGTIEFQTPGGGRISALGIRAAGSVITTIPVLAKPQ